MPDTPGGEQRVEAAARALHHYNHSRDWERLMEYQRQHFTRCAEATLAAADAVDPLRSPATTDDRADAELAERMEAIRESEREAWHDSTPANPRTFSEEFVRSLTESLTAKEREVVEQRAAIAAIVEVARRQIHRRYFTGRPDSPEECAVDGCTGPWPCEMARALAALEEGDDGE